MDMTIDREELQRRVHAALAQVRHPTSGDDLIATGHVGELTISDDAVVRFTFALRPDDPGTLVREVRSAVEAVDGVARVRIDVKLPQEVQAPQQNTRTMKPGTVPAPTPDAELARNIAHVVAVSSGKGGVGKSTVAANLAAALAEAGRRVGLLDADVYGPNVPIFFGEKGKPRVTGAKGEEKIVPLEAHGVKLMSLGFLLEDEQPAIMRGPLISGILRQFLEQVEWGELDYLIVDMPPGTGDAQLSLVQTINLDGALMVTTPQELSTADVRRGIRMFERVNTRVLGVVENMSGFECPCCGERIDIFGSGGGDALAEDMHLPVLAKIPLDVRVREAADSGQPTAVSNAESPAGREFLVLADRVIGLVEAAAAAGAF